LLQALAGRAATSPASPSEEVAPKRLELLHELLPKTGVLALLVNPTAPELAEPQTREVLSAAQALGIDLHVLNASTEQDLDRIFAKLTELRAGGLVIGGDAFFTSHAKQLAALTVRHAVPAIYQWREFAAGRRFDDTETHHLVGIYIGRILKGGKPADLPVQQATKVEMFINLKTARALSITIPLPLSGRAEGLDTTTPAGKAMFQMMGVFAEFERAMIAERVRAGLARARGEGKRLGRPPIAPALEKRIREALATPRRPGVRVIAKQFGINPGTVQRISRPFEQDAVAL
jgi:hypothetical protein